MNDVVKEWRAKAEGDYATARHESAARTSPNFDAVCFHAQQCIEKHLKALIICHGNIPPKTHDLVTLGRLAAKVWRKEHAGAKVRQCVGASVHDRGLAARRRKGRVKEESFSALLMHVLASGPLSKANIAHAIGREKPDGQLHSAVNALVAGGLVERTLPDKPNNRLQHYRLMEKGQQMMV